MRNRINSLNASDLLRYMALSILGALSMLMSRDMKAQTTSQSSNIISYQGSVTANGTPVTGEHVITTTIYSDPNGTTPVWTGSYKQTITGGVFTVLLGSGNHLLPASEDFSKPHWVGVRVDDGAELRPLTQLTAAPYAISVPDKSITKAKLADEVVLGNLKGGGAPQNIIFNACVTNLNDDGAEATNTIAGGCGNTTVNGLVIPTYATISGGLNNRAWGTASVVSGGDTNLASGNRAVVSGGSFNSAGDFSAIPGGAGLSLGNYSFGFNGSTSPVNVSSNSNLAYFNDIDLWLANDDNSSRKLKFFEPSSYGANYTSFRANDAGQSGTNIQYQLPATHGNALDVLTNNGSDELFWESAEGIGAWAINGNSNTDPVLGNYLGTYNDKAFEIHVWHSDGTDHRGSRRVMRFDPNTVSPNITGGFQGNYIRIAGYGNTIAGGGSYQNENIIGDDGIITEGNNDSGFFCFIGAGRDNHIAGGESNVICGGGTPGLGNLIWSGDLGVPGKLMEHPIGNFIGSGENNTIDNILGSGRVDTLNYAVIAGGRNNLITNGYSFIGGGDGNYINDRRSVICGGEYNSIFAFGVNSIIAGGSTNSILGSFNVISGGSENSVQTNGFSLPEYASIGGGSNNVVTNDGMHFISHQTIPGGDSLVAQSYAQTVIGHNNKPQGSSYKPLNQDVSGLIFDDRLFIIGNGLPPRTNSSTHALILGTPSNAYEVSNSGHAIVYHNDGTNPSNGATSATPSFPAIKGARYIDNTPIAWGIFDPNSSPPTGALTSSFGCSGGTTNIGGPGWYTITLNYVDPYTGNQVRINHGSSVVATVVGSNCDFVSVSPVTWNGTANTFDIYVTKNTFNPSTMALDCVSADVQVSFVVFGRP